MSEQDATPEEQWQRRQRLLARMAQYRLSPFGPRYSRFVGLMKVFLPAMAIGLLLMVLAWPDRQQLAEPFGLTFTNQADPAASPLQMVNPRYTSIDANDRPILITAETATRTSSDDQVINLRDMQADFTMDNNTWVSVLSGEAVLDQSQQQLHMQGPIDVYSDRGFEFHAQEMAINLKSGEARSQTPINGHGPFGQIEADTMRLERASERLHFEGRVRVVIHGAS